MQRMAGPRYSFIVFGEREGTGFFVARKTVVFERFRTYRERHTSAQQLKGCVALGAGQNSNSTAWLTLQSILL